MGVRVLAEMDWTIEQIREEIESADMSREELLAEIGKTLRVARVALPNIRAIHEAGRYQGMLEDIEAAELMYGQYTSDRDGTFGLEDFQEMLALIRLSHLKVTDIMDKYIRGEWEAPAA